MPKEEKGLLTKALESWLGLGFVMLLKLKGFWKKAMDIGLPKLIGLIDDTLGEKVPEPYKTEIREALDAAIVEKDYDVAIDMITRLGDKFIDVPGLDDPAEAAMFEALGSMIKSILFAFKKQESIEEITG